MSVQLDRYRELLGELDPCSDGKLPTDARHAAAAALLVLAEEQGATTGALREVVDLFSEREGSR